MTTSDPHLHSSHFYAHSHITFHISDPVILGRSMHKWILILPSTTPPSSPPSISDFFVCVIVLPIISYHAQSLKMWLKVWCKNITDSPNLLSQFQTLPMPYHTVSFFCPLLFQAIIESPNNQLTLSDIYAWFQSTFGHFRQHNATWKVTRNFA